MASISSALLSFSLSPSLLSPSFSCWENRQAMGKGTACAKPEGVLQIPAPTHGSPYSQALPRAPESALLGVAPRNWHSCQAPQGFQNQGRDSKIKAGMGHPCGLMAVFRVDRQ